MANTPRNGKIALAAIDEANLFGLARTFRKVIDWKLLREHLMRDYDGETVVYVGLPPASHPDFHEARTKKLRFVHWLRTHGFMVVTKDGSPTESREFKANVDVLMAIDTMDLARECDPGTVILVTGDSDFAHLAISLRRRGVCVIVAALEQNLGAELRASANRFIDLSEIFAKFGDFENRMDVPAGQMLYPSGNQREILS